MRQRGPVIDAGIAWPRCEPECDRQLTARVEEQSSSPGQERRGSLAPSPQARTRFAAAGTRARLAKEPPRDNGVARNALLLPDICGHEAVPASMLARVRMRVSTRASRRTCSSPISRLRRVTGAGERRRALVSAQRRTITGSGRMLAARQEQVSVVFPGAEARAPRKVGRSQQRASGWEPSTGTPRDSRGSDSALRARRPRSTREHRHAFVIRPRERFVTLQARRSLNQWRQARASAASPTSWALCSQSSVRLLSWAWALGATTFSSSMYSPVRAAASSDSASQTSERAPRSGERKKGAPSVATTFQIRFRS
jgi:hypothetical protein